MVEGDVVTTKCSSTKAIVSKKADKKDLSDDEIEANYDFRIVYAAFFCIYLGRTLVLPLLTFYADDINLKKTRKGLTKSQQGILAGLFYLTYSTGGAIYGSLSNYIGRRPIILTCLVGMTLGFIAQGMAQTYETLVIFRTLTGFFAAISGIVQTYIADICLPVHLAKYTSRVGIFYGLCWGLGPGFAVVLCCITEAIIGDYSDKDKTIKYRTGFIVGASFTSFVALIAFRKLKESLPESLRKKKQCITKKNNENKKDIEMETCDTNNTSNNETNNSDSNIEKQNDEDFAALYEATLPDNQKTPQFKNRLFKYLIIIIICTFFGDWIIGGHSVIYSLMNDKQESREYLNWTEQHFGPLWVVYGLSYSAVQLFYVKLQKRMGPILVYSLGAFISAIGNALIPFISQMIHDYKNSSNVLKNGIVQVIMLIPASMIVGIGYGLTLTSSQTIVSDLSKRYNIRKVGNWLSAWMFAVAFGSAAVMVSGFMAQKINPSGTLYFGAGLSVLCCVITLLLHFDAKDIKIAVDVKEVIEEDNKLGEGLQESTNIHESGHSILTPALSFASSNNYSTKNIKLHQNITAPQFNNQFQSHLLPPVNKTNVVGTSTPPVQVPNTTAHPLKKTNYSSCYLSVDNLSTGTLSRATTFTKESFQKSLSSFFVSTPFGFPIVTPSSVQSIPMINGQIVNNTILIPTNQNTNTNTNNNNRNNLFLLPPTIQHNNNNNNNLDNKTIVINDNEGTISTEINNVSTILEVFDNGSNDDSDNNNNQNDQNNSILERNDTRNDSLVSYDSKLEPINEN